MPSAPGKCCKKAPSPQAGSRTRPLLRTSCRMQSTMAGGVKNWPSVTTSNVEADSEAKVAVDEGTIRTNGSRRRGRQVYATSTYAAHTRIDTSPFLPQTGGSLQSPSIGHLQRELPGTTVDKPFPPYMPREAYVHWLLEQLRKSSPAALGPIGTFAFGNPALRRIKQLASSPVQGKPPTCQDGIL